ncbi:MAG: hypothetical protein ACI3ZA_07515 [Alloprevotella sp.]
MLKVRFNASVPQGAALKDNFASPEKLKEGVFADPALLELPSLTHCFPPPALTKVQPVLSVVTVAVAILPDQDPSLPPVPLHLSNVSEKMVVVSCPHALLPNTKEAMISKRRRDWLIPVLRKSFSIIIIF